MRGPSASRLMASRYVTTTRSLSNLWVSAHSTNHVDFETIQKKLDQGFSQVDASAKGYSSVQEFSQDIIRVFENARQYNKPDTIYFKYANQLEQISKGLLNRLQKVEQYRNPNK